MERTILHMDLNNFYASVECLLRPEIRNKPVAVGGNPKARHGVVLAKNNIAKACGVKTGETLWQAEQKCPGIIFVSPNFELYREFSNKAREICYSYTNLVEPFGLDESWMDVTQSIHLFGNGKKIADEMRNRFKHELGLTISVGVSFNKIFAKLGSDYKKPDATTVININNYKSVAWKLPVGELLYVGRKTQKKLERLNIFTIGELALADSKMLYNELGKVGVLLWRFANGEDNSPVLDYSVNSDVKSIGNSITLPYDISDEEDIKMVIMSLSESVARRLRDKNLKCRSIQLGLRDKFLLTFERQLTLPQYADSSYEIWHSAFELYKKNSTGLNPIRSISVTASKLDDEAIEQLSIFQEHKHIEKILTLEKAIDDIRDKFGYFSIQRAVMLTNEMLGRFNLREDNVVHPVSYFKNGDKMIVSDKKIIEKI